jgi:hypothetical protein
VVVAAKAGSIGTLISALRPAVRQLAFDPRRKRMSTITALSPRRTTWSRM